MISVKNTDTKASIYIKKINQANQDHAKERKLCDVIAYDVFKAVCALGWMWLTLFFILCRGYES